MSHLGRQITDLEDASSSDSSSESEVEEMQMVETVIVHDEQRHQYVDENYVLASDEEYATDSDEYDDEAA